MKYFVRVGGRELEVSFEERDGEVFARVGDVERRVGYAEVDGLGQYSILVDGRSWAASIEPAPRGSSGEFSVGLAGEVFDVSIENERERSAHAAERVVARGPRTVRAAMPGIVIAVVTSEGEVVEKEAPLMVIEAMKMQNEVRAEAGGKVAKLFVAPGRTVAAGDPLAVIEPAGIEPAGIEPAGIEPAGIESRVIEPRQEG
jgi:biotin carboxyl carrier protein